MKSWPARWDNFVETIMLEETRTFSDPSATSAMTPFLQRVWSWLPHSTTLDALAPQIGVDLDQVSLHITVESRKPYSAKCGT